ncbi:hypothetical protein EXU57_23115 [Segetibacter sp. 3557_3]|uniref:hypothetical protein n=1 Tax=Segetibacter sp. 3557_3 TaxID=2547429 RepID=UPI001058B350|nr:hypothetical protein [Segetibacter sp. 3557_3]TDH18491.1 hypothetical protein EXU57_23115 [Segetibacter sp. 3557_3]
MSQVVNDGVGGFVQSPELSPSIKHLPLDRTLYAGLLTANPPVKPTIAEGLTDTGKVLEHYQPCINVAFEDKNGTTREETIRFKSLADFSLKSFVAQSGLLKELSHEKEQYQKLGNELRFNRVLNKALSDPITRQYFLNFFKEMMNELDGAK